MTASAFSQLYRVVGNEARLASEYSRVLEKLFGRPLWTSGPPDLQRVCWTDCKRASSECPEAFAMPCLYIWGAKTRPLYIGIARDSWKKRIRRYVGGSKAQCNL